MFDYHVHTEFSVDCNVPMKDSCEAAIAAGITEIAFTDHIDHQPEDPGTGYYDHDGYFRSLEQVRNEFGEQLVVLAGAEIDFHSDIAEEVEHFVNQWGSDYDFVLGSIHYASGGRLIYPALYESLSLEDVFLPFFDQIEIAVRTGWFDSIGHMDIPKRYLPREKRIHDPVAYRERLNGLFEVMVAEEVAFEINTSGIRQAPKSSMPGPSFVRWYVDAGGTRITTGTDSHGARTVGAAIPETLQMLRLCGVSQVQSFRNREGRGVPIDVLLDPTSGSH